MKRSFKCLPTDCNTCDRYKTKQNRIFPELISYSCDGLGVAKYTDGGRHPLCPKMLEDRLLEAEDILQSIINKPDLDKHIKRIKKYIELHPRNLIE